jgi:TPP-dependent pyruvate/acetoin dehydrogenase alpha subunit
LQTRQDLLAQQVCNDEELAAMEAALTLEIEQAFAWASQGTRPTIESMRQHLYA